MSRWMASNDRAARGSIFGSSTSYSSVNGDELSVLLPASSEWTISLSGKPGWPHSLSASRLRAEIFRNSRYTKLRIIVRDAGRVLRPGRLSQVMRAIQGLEGSTASLIRVK
jgi:hypothetical protein